MYTKKICSDFSLSEASISYRIFLFIVFSSIQVSSSQALMLLVIAEEPTNNIDISSMDILANTLKCFKGTLLVVSHDEQFVKDIGIERLISL